MRKPFQSYYIKIPKF